jgi:peptidoglycan/xylan/chitin deacetylase (PgdA/CDA1 family)
VSEALCHSAQHVPAQLAILESLGAQLTRGRLRVLAYHGVDDEASFAAQMAHISEHYTPVSALEVIGAYCDGAPLPTRAVWVTFDDGLPSAVERGLPILNRFGLHATLFVSPGLIESGEPNWWDVVGTAVAHGITCPEIDHVEGSLVSDLKARPDHERRAVVAKLAGALDGRCIAVPSRQLTHVELDEWWTAGNDVGNHSWDHPCLDRCTPGEQHYQVSLADAWLRARRPDGPLLFAYPNGNTTPHVEETLATLGYKLALLFDHRLATLDQYHLRISRLRVSSTASITRFGAILSGAHGVAYHVKRRLRPSDSDTSLRGRLQRRPRLMTRIARTRKA